jgi:hypothetical protein
MGPMFTSVVVPATATVGTSHPLRASALDPDGAAVDYAWTATCGTIVGADLAEATWTAPATPPPAGGCSFMIVASSDGLTASRQYPVTIWDVGQGART